MDLTHSESRQPHRLKWIIVIIGLICLAILCLVGTVLSVNRTNQYIQHLKTSAVYQQVLVTIRSDAEVVQALGEPIESGWWVVGAVGVAGRFGQSNLEFPVAGPKNSGRVSVVAVRVDQVWEFRTLEVTVADQGQRINLVASPTVILTGIYDDALRKVEADSEVRQALGTPIWSIALEEASFDAEGTTSVGQVLIKIAGPENSGMLYAAGTAETGPDQVWEYTVLEVVVEGQARRINLLE